MISTYTPNQITSYARGLLVRAVDPLTHGALRERLSIVGDTVHLRSFLEPPTPAGHTIKGSGMVAYRANRKNTQFAPLPFNLHRAMDLAIRSMGVEPSDYSYGHAQILDASAIVSINGRRSETNKNNLNTILTYSFSH